VTGDPLKPDKSAGLERAVKAAQDVEVGMQGSKPEVKSFEDWMTGHITSHGTGLRVGVSINAGGE